MILGNFFFAYGQRYPLEIKTGTEFTDHAEHEYAIYFGREPFLKNRSGLIWFNYAYNIELISSFDLFNVYQVQYYCYNIDLPEDMAEVQIQPNLELLHSKIEFEFHLDETEIVFTWIAALKQIRTIRICEWVTDDDENQRRVKWHSVRRRSKIVEEKWTIMSNQHVADRSIFNPNQILIQMSDATVTINNRLIGYS